MLSLVQKEDLEKAEARIKTLEMAIDTFKNRIANMDKQLQELASINRRYGPHDPFKPSTPWVDTNQPNWPQITPKFYPSTNPCDWTSPGYPPYTVTCDASKLMKNEETN